MTDEAGNPYEAAPLPASALDSDPTSPTNRRYVLMGGLVLALSATLLTFVLPAIAVPAALLLMPLTLRTIEVTKVRRAKQIGMSTLDWAQLVLVSLLAAIPIGLASLLLFCCVCTPVGFVASAIKSAYYGPTPLGLGVAVFTGLSVALWVGSSLFSKSGYLSKEVKEARSQAT